MQTFAERLTEARERAGYKSAESFANVLGMNGPAYRKYERGTSEPNFETLTRICELLECTPNDLLPDARDKRSKGPGGGAPDRESVVETILNGPPR